MAYVSIPNDLSKIKTKLALNLTSRQLVCFGGAVAVGIPAFLLCRSAIGNTGAMFLMLALMLPAFFMAMYERDGQTLEKIICNILRARFLRPKVRPYQTQNLYAFFNEMEVHHAKQTAKKTGRKTAKKHPAAKKKQKVGQAIFRKKEER